MAGQDDDADSRSCSQVGSDESGASSGSSAGEEEDANETPPVQNLTPGETGAASGFLRNRRERRRHAWGDTAETLALWTSACSPCAV